MADFQRAMRDPSSCYKEPKDVLDDNDLSKEQKIKVLQQWDYDAREQSVAEEENMAAPGPDHTFMIRRIQEALRTLGVKKEGPHPTKQ